MPEIERKWRISHVLGRVLRGVTPQRLTQAYLVTSPGELRVRTDGTTAWITAKSDGSLVREEWEDEIPLWVFDQLLASTALRVEKLRYRVELNERIWEVDVYQGQLAGLITVETECASEMKALTLSLPESFGYGEEVTYDHRYKNKCLAVDGLPSSTS